MSAEAVGAKGGAATQDVNVTQVAGTATAVNTGVASAGTQRVVIATDQPAFSVNSAAAASELHLGEVGGALSNPSANFTRPADTTAYAIGDLIANSTTAGAVVPLSWTAMRVAAGSSLVRRIRLQKSTTSLTNASFRLHLYSADPSASSGITNGDNGAWLTKIAGYLGSCDVVMDKAFSDAAAGQGAPAVGADVDVKLASGQTLYGLLEARAAYAPGNAEVFTVVLELLQN